MNARVLAVVAAAAGGLYLLLTNTKKPASVIEDKPAVAEKTAVESPTVDTPAVDTPEEAVIAVDNAD